MSPTSLSPLASFPASFARFSNSSLSISAYLEGYASKPLEHSTESVFFCRCIGRVPYRIFCLASSYPGRAPALGIFFSPPVVIAPVNTTLPLRINFFLNGISPRPFGKKPGEFCRRLGTPPSPSFLFFSAASNCFNHISTPLPSRPQFYLLNGVLLGYIDFGTPSFPLGFSQKARSIKPPCLPPLLPFPAAVPSSRFVMTASCLESRTLTSFHSLDLKLFQCSIRLTPGGSDCPPTRTTNFVTPNSFFLIWADQSPPAVESMRSLRISISLGDMPIPVTPFCALFFAHLLRTHCAVLGLRLHTESSSL